MKQFVKRSLELLGYVIAALVFLIAAPTMITLRIVCTVCDKAITAIDNVADPLIVGLTGDFFLPADHFSERQY